MALLRRLAKQGKLAAYLKGILNYQRIKRSHWQGTAKRGAVPLDAVGEPAAAGPDVAGASGQADRSGQLSRLLYEALVKETAATYLEFFLKGRGESSRAISKALPMMGVSRSPVGVRVHIHRTLKRLHGDENGRGAGR